MFCTVLTTLLWIGDGFVMSVTELIVQSKSCIDIKPTPLISFPIGNILGGKDLFKQMQVHNNWMTQFLR